MYQRKYQYFFENGKEGYTNFRKERFIEKNKKLSDTRKRVNLPAFDRKYKSMPVTTDTTSKLAIKELSQAQRLIDIARSRMIPMTELLKFDMGIQNSLFDGEFTAKPDKYLLVSELKKSLVGTTYEFKKDNFRPTALIVDFMALVRKMNLSKMRIFNDVFEQYGNQSKTYAYLFNQLDGVYEFSKILCENTPIILVIPLNLSILQNSPLSRYRSINFGHVPQIKKICSYFHGTSLLKNQRKII